MNTPLIDKILEILGPQLGDKETAHALLIEGLADVDGVVWSTKDIHAWFEGSEFQVSEEDARNALHEAVDDSDGEYGLTWERLGLTAKRYICKHCKRSLSEHAGEKCLYDSTSFTPLTNL